MVANKDTSNIYCRPFMVNEYLKENNFNYQKFDELKIEKISKGIVHPLNFSDYNAPEKNEYGGVTDENLNFIDLSANKRVKPHFMKGSYPHQWYVGANPNTKLIDINFQDYEVIFLGALHKHYGHFILESLSRLWVCFKIKKSDYKFVYISGDGNDRFTEFFDIFGIKKNNIQKIIKPTQFRSIIIPEPSMRLYDYYHLDYKKIIDKIKENVKASNIEKVYFSKSGIKNNRAFNEKSIESVFARNGFKIFHPEKLSIYEMISILKGCKVFASTSATNNHNAIFMNDKNTFICLNRSAHFHPPQTMIEKMRSLRGIYIDVFYFSSNKNFGDMPCLICPTQNLFDFFKSYNFKFNKFRLYIIFVFNALFFLSFVKLKYLIYKNLRKILFKN